MVTLISDSGGLDLIILVARNQGSLTHNYNSIILIKFSKNAYAKKSAVKIFVRNKCEFLSNLMVDVMCIL